MLSLQKKKKNGFQPRHLSSKFVDDIENQREIEICKEINKEKERKQEETENRQRDREMCDVTARPNVIASV